MSSPALPLLPVDPVAHLRRSRVAAVAVLVVALLQVHAGLSRGDLLRQWSAPIGGASASDVDYGDLPLAFAPVAAGARTFAAGLPSVQATVSPTGAVLALGPAGDTSLGLRLLGANAAARPTALDRLPGVVNDLRGAERSAWRTDVPTHARVRFRSVYPGVDVDWHGNGRHLEYDFRLAPGADPASIAVRFDGSDSLRVTPDGALVASIGAVEVRQPRPVAWQRAAEGSRVPVAASFALVDDTVGVRLGAYDRSAPLVIDPVVQTYSTYLGGSGIDGATAIAVDATGAAYLTGTTSAPDFPTVGPFQTDRPSIDSFVTKLNPAGNAIVYSTYLGGLGGGVDGAASIAIDTAGAAYVTGTTSSTDFPLVNPVEGNGGGDDAFLSKLSPAGNALVYSTYLGGLGRDEAFGVAVDGAGVAWIAGVSDSTDINTLNPIEASTIGPHLFISRFSATGGLTFSTKLGGSSYEKEPAIAVDSTGAAYVTGTTGSTNYDTLNPYEVDGGDDDEDAFVTKLSGASVPAMVYSTYLGGSEQDAAVDIAVDGGGSAYVVGVTRSADFDRVGGVEGFNDSDDAFVTKLSPAGNTLVYSSFLGGGLVDSAGSVAVDGVGQAYVAGTTDSHDFNHVGQTGPAGGTVAYDAWVAKFNTAGSALRYSVEFGGLSNDLVLGVAIDPLGDAYVTGSTGSVDFPVVGGVQDNDTIGDGFSGDAFVTKLHERPQPDAKIRRSSDAAYVGNDVYNTTGTHQGRSSSNRRGTTATFVTQVENDGPSPDQFTVRGSAASSGFTVRYLAGSTDVTAAVLAGTFSSGTLAPGAAVTLKVKVVVGAATAFGRAQTVGLTATSAALPTQKDKVTATVTVVR